MQTTHTPEHLVSPRTALMRAAFITSALVLTQASTATGLATCDSGAKSTWQSVDKLEQVLKEKGYTVRRIKEDGGCYEAYVIDDKGQRAELYFHPVTLAPVPTAKK